MRFLKIYQQNPWYSTYADKITEYCRDSDEKIIYDEIDDELIQRIKCEQSYRLNEWKFVNRQLHFYHFLIVLKQKHRFILSFYKKGVT